MNYKISKGFLLIPATYGILALLFLFTHFAQREQFSGVMKSIIYTGKMTLSKPDSPSEILSMKVRYNGAVLTADRLNPLIMITSDGIHHRRSMTGYSLDGQELSIQYKNDLFLRFTPDPNSNTVSLSFLVPVTVPPIQDLIIPFKAQENYNLIYDKESELYSLVGDNSQFFLNLPEGASISLKEKQITIPIMDNPNRTLTLEDTIGEQYRSLAEWTAEQSSNLTQSVYTETIQAYIGKSYMNWQERFSSMTGIWSHPDGSGDSFDEQTAVYQLAESLPRNEYNAMRSSLSTASSRNTTNSTWYSAPFLGDIVTKGREKVESEKALVKTLTSLISENDPDLFKTSRLADLVSHPQLSRLSTTVLNMAVTVTKETPVSELMNRAEVLLAYSEQEIATPELIPELSTLFEEYLIPHIIWVDDNLFLLDENSDTIITEHQVYLGSLLIRGADVLKNELYRAAGKKLIQSLLSLFSDDPYLPEQISLRGHEIDEKIGILSPETIYPYISENPFLPRRISLSRQIGPGAWAWSSAETLIINQTDRETILSIDYPADSIHYLIIHGIRPFTRLYLHGFYWKSDPNFQRYSDGLFYDKENQTLYMKIRHRLETERVRILYYYPEEE